MKKTLSNKILTAIIFILITMSLLLLSSCDSSKSEKPGGQNGDKDKNSGVSDFDGNADVIINESAVWGKGIRLKVVIPKEGGEKLEKIREYLCSDVSFLTDTPARAYTDEFEYSGHEVVIGKTTRAISQKAYSELDKHNDIKTSDGWLIYADGNSMAIAYSSNAALDKAIDYLYTNFLETEELVFEESGVVDSFSFNLKETADAARIEIQGAGFISIEKSAGKETADALRKLYTLYSDEVYRFFAELYDPKIGGFYYSNSGRDNSGFLPDIESTVQALNHLSSGGMFADFSNSYVSALPEEMKDALLSFAKGLQSSKDGYFYHPQWGTDIIVARRGRDLGWALQLIKALGGKPYWNVANTIGEYGAPSAAASCLTTGLSTSDVVAVSKVVCVSKYLPDHLTSLEKWKTYIDELNIYNDPYTSGNTLAAQHNEISAAGEEYIDYLTDYLTDLQDPVTGFWGEGVSYVTMNGFMKLSFSYSYYGRAVPHCKEALLSTVDILLTPDTPERDLHVCNTYNTWVNFCQVFTSLKKVEGGEETIKELRGLLLEKAPELINITFDKIATHKQAEGGFSYFETKPCNASQKAPVGCALYPESDVNATSICTTGIVSNIFSALGLKKVPLYCAADADVFFRIIETKNPIVKIQPDVDFPDISGVRGTGKYYDISKKFNGYSAPTVSSATAVSLLSNTEDKYVYFYKDVDEGEQNKSDSISHELPSTKPQDSVGIVFELDIAFGGFSNRTSSNNYAGFQINLYDRAEYASLYFNYSDGHISTQWSTVIDGNAIFLDENKWYNLRLESYEYESTRAIKIYVNGIYACTVKSADDKTTTSGYVATVLRQFETDDWVAFDNIYTGYYTK